jgi:hypothetical protein
LSLEKAKVNVATPPSGSMPPLTGGGPKIMLVSGGVTATTLHS